MKSPFPGMDPYLERHWLDVDVGLITRAATTLNRLLPDDLVARCEERFAVEPDNQGSDVDSEPLSERFIRIIGADDERLITVIEFVSPTNKIGKGLEKFLQRRDELLESGVHVVEIDLVRQGDWRELLRPHRAPPKALATYRTTIRIGGRREIAYLYPMSVRQPLPAIAIPLRPGDAQVLLDLQKLVDDVYDTGRYARTLDYTKPPVPELEPDEAAWASETVKAAASRA